MDVLQITGGKPLIGTVSASGAKNAALPILAACLLTEEPVQLRRVPAVRDVDTMSLLLGHLGTEVKRDREGMLHMRVMERDGHVAPVELVSQMRASFCVLGPLLAKRRRAVVALPGGCQLGTRPVNVHLAALEKLGAEIRIEDGCVVATATQLRGATIDLTGPRGSTVTGTAHAMMAAVLARGETILQNCACEPEVVDLGQFLVALGARIDGLGTGVIRIRGVEQLGGTEYTILPDRIETGTYLIAAAISQGDVRVENCQPAHLEAVLAVLEEAGCDIECGPNWIRARTTRWPRPLNFTALPYPSVPTDLQAPLMALAAVADGESTVDDDVFPERFAHVPQLRRMGAMIDLHNNRVTIRGCEQLRGTSVAASDLRGAAALVLAGLVAEGETTISGIQHLERGYERFAEKLRSLGAIVGPAVAKPQVARHRYGKALTR